MHDCVYFLFGFWMMNIRIMFQRDLKLRQVLAKVRRVQRLTMGILTGYLAITASWLVGTFFVKVVKR